MTTMSLLLPSFSWRGNGLFIRTVSPLVLHGATDVAPNTCSNTAESGTKTYKSACKIIIIVQERESSDNIIDKEKSSKPTY